MYSWLYCHTIVVLQQCNGEKKINDVRVSRLRSFPYYHFFTSTTVYMQQDLLTKSEKTNSSIENCGKTLPMIAISLHTIAEKHDPSFIY